MPASACHLVILQETKNGTLLTNHVDLSTKPANVSRVPLNSQFSEEEWGVQCLIGGSFAFKLSGQLLIAYTQRVPLGRIVCHTEATW